MNTELVDQALEKVGNPNILVNLVSRRVRQLSQGGAGNRPLIERGPRMGNADIALTEIVGGQMDYELDDENPLKGQDY